MTFQDAIDNDLEMMLTSEFSKSITIASGNVSVSVLSIYDKTYLDIEPETGNHFMSTKPRATVKDALVPFKLAQGQTVTVDGKTWAIFKPVKNGDGSTTLYLD